MNQIEDQIKIHQNKIIEYTNKIKEANNIEEQLHYNNSLKEEKQFLESLLLININLKKEYESHMQNNNSKTNTEEKNKQSKNNLENLNEIEYIYQNNNLKSKTPKKRMKRK